MKEMKGFISFENEKKNKKWKSVGSLSFFINQWQDHLPIELARSYFLWMYRSWHYHKKNILKLVI
jgi:hypothetical protein